MTSKEYLEQIYKLDHKINAMELRSQEYERLSCSTPGLSYGERIGSNPNRNLKAPFVKWIMKKDEIDRKIKQLKSDLDTLKAEAILKIEELENEDYKNLLVLKYLKFQTIEEIASKLYTSVATVKRWHIKALELIIN